MFVGPKIARSTLLIYTGEFFFGVRCHFSKVFLSRTDIFL